MRRKDLLAVIVMVAASLALLVLSGLFSSPGGGADSSAAFVRMTAPGRKAELIPLNQTREVTLDQESGGHNVVEIFPGGFRMKESNCKNQDCIRQGGVTLGNLGTRALNHQVICLPNKVVLELTDGDSNVLSIE